MPRYVGHKEGKICVVSDMMVSSSDLKWAEVPDRLRDVSEKELVVGYYVDDDKVESKSAKKLVEHLRLAFVSNYAMKCGISTYAEHLLPKLVPWISDYKLFVEEDISKHNEYRLDGKPIPLDKISVCWKRGESLSRLINEVKAYGPDIVIINHEWGIFPNARYWLSLLTQLSKYRVIVILHSIFGHMDKLVCEAAMKEIIVHLDGAKKILIDKGISSQIYVIPHGCPDIDDKPKLWNFYKSNHTLIQQGFLFSYKGYDTSLKAIALLKNKYPDIFFTGLCSESPFAMDIHNNLYDDLLNIINELNLQENVALIRGYQSDKVLDTFFKMNKIAIFPYRYQEEHECFGSSGAAPFAMSKEIPVITTSINHFSGLPTIKINSVEELAYEIDMLFSNKLKYNSQIILQNNYLENNSWTSISKKFLSIF